MIISLFTLDEIYEQILHYHGPQVLALASTKDEHAFLGITVTLWSNLRVLPQCQEVPGQTPLGIIYGVVKFYP